MEVYDIFPAAFAVTELESLTPDIIKKAIEIIELGSQVEDVSSDGAYTGEQQLLNKVLFRDVKAEIIKFCLEYARSCSHKVSEIHICNSWGNIIGLGQSIHTHRHVNSYISGAFYLTEGSAFTFHNLLGENLFPIMPAVELDDNYRSKTSFVINPKPGRMILFPSGLHHSVLNSDSQEKRYSIAFNTMPVGKIGTPTNFIEYREP